MCIETHKQRQPMLALGLARYAIAELSCPACQKGKYRIPQGKHVTSESFQCVIRGDDAATPGIGNVCVALLQNMS